MLKFTKVLALLDHNRYCSGQDLAEKLNVTRATIHNCIEKIESLGIGVSRVRGLGYRLSQPLDLLSHEAILNEIPSELKANLESLHCLQEIDSTNQFATNIALPKNDKFSAVLAETQSSGRGRRGRTWVSPYSANIYMSIVWSLQRPIHDAGVLSPFIAYRVLLSLQALGIKNLGLKWPNDVYANDKKLAGILIECTGEVGGACKMIVGIGVNVSMSKFKDISIDQDWTDIVSNTEHWSVSRNQLAVNLMNSIVSGLMLFERNEIGELVKQWLCWDVVKNKHVYVQSAQATIEGVARGIDVTGSLLLETLTGIEKISAGDVSLRVES